MRDSIGALFAGTIFGAGLAVAQMTNPAKVIGFLDVAGHWDPSLAFVMGAALVVSAVSYRIHRKAIANPSAGIDTRLIAGAILFGLGWGLAGFCPGPAIASLVTGSGHVALFVVSMILGMGLYRALGEHESRMAATPPMDA